MQKLVIIRGLPGSGKSTLARSLNLDRHFEADQYFVGDDGLYHFDASKLGEAHKSCQLAVDMALESGLSVVVSNTFTTKKELKPYFGMAEKRGLVPIVIHCQNTFKNVHSVPEEALKRMKDRFEYDISDLFEY